MRRQRIVLLGTSIDVTNYERSITDILSWVKRREKVYVCFVNVYALMTFYKDPSLRAVVNAARLTAPDGMPLVWVGKIYNKRMRRVYGTTLVRTLLRIAPGAGLRLYLLGGQRGQSTRLMNALRNDYPGLRIVGVHETPDRPIKSVDNARIIQDINTKRADVVLVGLGVPHQERWIAANREKIDAPVLMGVGSTIDFLSRDKKEAPEWVQKAGGEWLYRFAQEPGRLWYRYTVINIQFLWLISLQLFRDLFRGAIKH